MKIILLREAFKELDDAISYYEDRQAGLGMKLKEEIDTHIKWISNNPEVSHIRKGGYRRVNLKVFPYYIAYIVREQTLWILAIARNVIFAFGGFAKIPLRFSPLHVCTPRASSP